MGNTQTTENSEIEKELLYKTEEKTLKSIVDRERKENERKQLKRGREVYNSLDKALLEEKNAYNFARNEMEGEARFNKEQQIKNTSKGVKELKNEYKKVSSAIENAAQPEQPQKVQQNYVLNDTNKQKRRRIADGKKRKSKTKKTKSTRKNKKN